MHRLLLFVCALFLSPPLAAQWLQFGGPGRDFTLDQAPRIAAWGAAGPRRLWQRDLGPGYSALISDPSTQHLFTATREGEQEVIVALEAGSGKTLWEYRYQAPVSELRGVDVSYGNAPQATPIFSDGRLFTLGFTGHLHALDAATGELLWAKDLGAEHQARIPYFGYAASPLLVDDPKKPGWRALVVLAGGALAFEPASGELLWQNRSFAPSYASPILAETAHGRQIIAAAAGEVVGLDPLTGSLLWRHEFANQHRTMLGTPILVDDDLLFVSAYFLGSRGLRLVAADRVEQLWQQPDFQVSHFNAVHQGGTIYTTYKNSLLALDARSGEILWRERRFGAANLLLADQQALLLGDRGELTIARLDRQGITRLQTTRVVEKRSWTPPTVIGNRLFLRDQAIVLALDLNALGEPQVAASMESELEVPAEFSAVIEKLTQASMRSDLEAIASGIESLSVWNSDPELATWSAYYRGFGLWILSLVGPGDGRLGYLDQAVEAEKRSIELEPRNAEAHALLSTLYSGYYRLAPQRAGVVGPLGDEHLGRALDLEPDNLRALAIRGLDLAYTPAQWGGDPAAARQQLAEVIARSATAPTARSNRLRPTWQAPMSRFWLARLLLLQEPKDAARARALLDETLEIYPHYAAARQLRDTLNEDLSATSASTQERGSIKASRRRR